MWAEGGHWSVHRWEVLQPDLTREGRNPLGGNVLAPLVIGLVLRYGFSACKRLPLMIWTLISTKRVSKGSTD